MNSTIRIIMVIAIFIYFICIIHLLKKERLNLKYSLLWLLSGLLMFLVVMFPNFIRLIIHKMGILELTNGVFAITIFLIIILLMSITSIVSTLNNRSRSLVQRCAMYEKRIRLLEHQIEELKKNQES